jgi:hydroxymethylpyrimidine kinase/phosphomethylpyrimidine kinase/thiamine-phosphate diphosphorylase
MSVAFPNRKSKIENRKSVVLTIAGSDPSGGAGVQADLRVIEALGCVGLSAITALTVQNSQDVKAVHPVPADVLYAQIEAVLDDVTVHAVKIGMLGGEAQVRAVAEALRRFRPPNVVLDPVLASTGGVPLLDDAGQAALISELLPLCDLVTPNLEEAQRFTGVTTATPEGMQEAGERLLKRGVYAVLVKGGHLPGPSAQDMLLSRNIRRWYEGARVETPHTHGTGCFLASAIAACLARGVPLVSEKSAPYEEAVFRAKELLRYALQSPVVAGRGRGYPGVLTADTRRQKAEGSALRARRQQKHKPLPTAYCLLPTAFCAAHAERVGRLAGLYVLTDSDLRPDRSAEAIAQAALEGGAAVVQLRDKRLPTSELIPLARRICRRCRAAGALFLVNDRADVALASDADGVHLGPEDMHPADARGVLGPDRLIGVSVSTIAEAEALAPFASYLGVGAIFGSATKGDAGPPIGVDRIREIKQEFPRHPLVAIGGIGAENIASVALAGAEAAAVVSAVVCAPDMRLATADLVARFRSAK